MKAILEEEVKIKQLKQNLLKLGPIHPGSINKQYNVCGKPICKCKDPKKPVRHGPYYQLSYRVAGRSSSKFLKKDALVEARKQTQRYQEFKRLISELVEAYVDLAKKTNFERR